MNNVALMFSPTDEKTPYEQAERIVRSYCSVGSRAIDTCSKFLKRFLAWTKPETVLMVYVKLRSVKDLILQGHKKKTKQNKTKQKQKQKQNENVILENCQSL